MAAGRESTDQYRSGSYRCLAFDGLAAGRGVQGGNMIEATIGNERAARHAPGALAHPITVEITDPARFGTLEDAWRDLIARAAVPNVSMHPAVAQSAAAAG